MAAEDEPQIIPQKFEVGSMIEFGEPVQYGVIKRLHELHADVELVGSPFFATATYM